MLNQEVIWQAHNAKNLHGDFTYLEPQIIKCRKEPHIEEVKDSEGRVHQSKHIFYTHADVQDDDILDGELVVKHYDMITLGGKIFLRRLITI